MSLLATDVVSEIRNSILPLCEAVRVFLFNIYLPIWELLKVIVLQKGRAEEVKDESENVELNALEVLNKSTAETSKWETWYDAF